MRTRRYGQNFLIDPGIAERMVGFAKVSKKDTVLEIGPGRGIITQFLAKKARKVYAIEMDRDLAEKLKGRWDNVEIIRGDAVRTKWPKFNKMVSNLPFKASTPITFKLLERKFDVAVLVYQEELGKRMMAKPGTKEYSRLTVAINYHCVPEIMQVLPRMKIRPRPKVESIIMRFRKRKPPFKADKKFWDFVNRLFQHKKKTVRAALKAAKLNHDVPEEIGKKRVFACTLKDLKKIMESLDN